MLVLLDAIIKREAIQTEVVAAALNTFYQVRLATIIALRDCNSNTSAVIYSCVFIHVLVALYEISNVPVHSAITAM